ncbi:arginine--tRNA ligase [Helicobacter sp. T3_23-1056]
MFASIKSIISEIIGQEVVLELPKNKDFGHIATPLAFSLAKEQKRSPLQIAQEICQKLESNPKSNATFSKISQINGYINLSLSADFFDECIAKAFENGLSYQKKDQKKDQTKDIAKNDLERRIETNAQRAKSVQPTHKKEKILLEYVSANPTGPLHIGHARGAVYGDSLKRVGEYLGLDITTEYYINDAGAQINKLAYSLALAALKILGAKDLPQELLDAEQAGETYKGEYIIKTAQDCIEHFGKDFFLPQMIMQNLNALKDFGKDIMLGIIKENLQNLNITFDNFVSEKSLYTQWGETLDELKAHNGIYEKDSKIWLKSSQFGDEKDRVVVRESGEETYLAGDIIYHRYKYMRGFSRLINIWGADHHGYIPRVKSAMEFLGFDSSRLEVLLAQMVSLLKDGKPYKMSKRAGNFILVSEVLSEVSQDELRFVFLSKKPDTHLEFDIDTLSKEDSSNPIFYINYANARIHTMMAKSALSEGEILSAKIASLANKEGENSEHSKQMMELAFASMLLPRIAEMAYDERSLQKICEYLKNLAGAYHGFYNATKILDSQNEAIYLKISKLVSLSITQGLALLGIKAKTKM